MLAMAKWVVDVIPIPGRSAATATERKLFATDNAAKAFVRDVEKMHFAVRVNSAPEVRPAIRMDHGQALRWAYS
jgi:hypothetical protein